MEEMNRTPGQGGVWSDREIRVGFSEALSSGWDPKAEESSARQRTGAGAWGQWQFLRLANEGVTWCRSAKLTASPGKCSAAQVNNTEGLLWMDTDWKFWAVGVPKGLGGGEIEGTLRNTKMFTYCKRLERTHIYQRRHILCSSSDVFAEIWMPLIHHRDAEMLSRFR